LSGDLTREVILEPVNKAPGLRFESPVPC